MALPDHYATLGLPRGASDLLVKKAYRQLVLRYHPDRNPGDRAAEEQFKKLAQAYETLSRPEKRAEYDELLASAQRSQQERMVDAIRRQEERQKEARERARARARRPRSTRPGYKGWQMGMEYRSNELDRRDALLGMIAGATLSTIFGAYFGRMELSLWLFLPFFGALLGKRVGLWLEERWEPRVADLSVGAELLSPLQILVAPLSIVIGANLAVMTVRSWVTLPADGIFGSALAGGMGAALGGGFGRAFTSVAKRSLSRNIGILIGAAIGGGFGALSASLLAMNLLSRWVDNGNYDSFLATVLAGLFGAALGSGQGSRRH